MILLHHINIILRDRLIRHDCIKLIELSISHQAGNAEFSAGNHQHPILAVLDCFSFDLILLRTGIGDPQR